MRTIGGPALGGGAAPTGPLKAWVRAELGLDDDVTVTVSELECTEPGCPPVETAITIFAPGEQPLLVKVAKPVADLERMDLVASLAFGGSDHH